MTYMLHTPTASWMTLHCHTFNASSSSAAVEAENFNCVLANILAIGCDIASCAHLQTGVRYRAPQVSQTTAGDCGERSGVPPSSESSLSAAASSSTPSPFAHTRTVKADGSSQGGSSCAASHTASCVSTIELSSTGLVLQGVGRTTCSVEHANQGGVLLSSSMGTERLAGFPRPRLQPPFSVGAIWSQRTSHVLWLCVNTD